MLWPLWESSPAEEGGFRICLQNAFVFSSSPESINSSPGAASWEWQSRNLNKNPENNPRYLLIIILCHKTSRILHWEGCVLKSKFILHQNQAVILLSSSLKMFDGENKGYLRYFRWWTGLYRVKQGLRMRNPGWSFPLAVTFCAPRCGAPIFIPTEIPIPILLALLWSLPVQGSHNFTFGGNCSIPASVPVPKLMPGWTHRPHGDPSGWCLFCSKCSFFTEILHSSVLILSLLGSDSIKIRFLCFGLGHFCLSPTWGSQLLLKVQ